MNRIDTGGAIWEVLLEQRSEQGAFQSPPKPPFFTKGGHKMGYLSCRQVIFPLC
jgi:hypothetical protein